MTTQFANIKLASITPSLTNPRKTFNADKLAELAHSIKTTGMHQPILVRPLAGSRVADTDRAVQFELVCGERRLRASQQAGLDTVPAMVRVLTDDQVLEIQLVENLQRDDLTAIEEAEGYDTLMQHASITADQVGEKIGKSRSYVYGRLKLLDLCTEARASLHSGAIDASRALLVARIPDHKLQIKAMKEIVDGRGYDKDPMSYRVAAAYLQGNYMLALSGAKFKIADAALLPDAGSCKTCPKRTGHDPDLFSDVKGADVCTDPPCFHKKEDAHAKALVSAAKAKGQTIIAGKEALELMPENGYNAKFKGYKRLDVAADSPTGVPLRKIIGKQMASEGIAAIVIAHPYQKGELVEVLPNEVVLRLLKAVEGHATDAKTVDKEVKALVDQKKAKADAKAKAQVEQDWRHQLVARTWNELRLSEDRGQAFDTSVHRYLALRTANSLSTDDATAICRVLEIGKVATHSELVDFVKTCQEPDMIHMLMIMQRGSSASDNHVYGGNVPNEGMHLVAGIVWRDKLADTIKQLKTEAVAKFMPDIKPKKAPPTTTPLPPAEHAPGSAKKGSKVKGPVPDRKPKMTETEAKSGIAAAMQDMEGAASAPKGAVALPNAQSGLAIGTCVKITDDLPNPRQQRFAGKKGTITGMVGRAWDVTFRGRIGGISSFTADQLSVVPA
ncbi:MAG: ParB/RepB/Spo0J family partition protein [Rhodoferax sp.]|nr:ParB/RepB/Spo0J family partition protein [Rhodoferax sp.]